MKRNDRRIITKEAIKVYGAEHQGKGFFVLDKDDIPKIALDENDDPIKIKDKNGKEVKDKDGRFKYKRMTTKYCVEFQERIPIGTKRIKSVTGDTGVDMIGNYLSMIYKFGAVIIGIVAVLVIVISGVQIMAGGASPEAVTQGKNRIFQAILSLILLLSSAMILRTINPGFFI